jgi:hypothetical protein
MNDTPHIAALPALDYCESKQSGALPWPVNLVLFAGAASGLAAACSGLAALSPLWFQTLSRHFISSPLELFYFGVLVMELVSPLAASVGCLVLLRAHSGRLLTLWAEAGFIASKACMTAFTLFEYISGRQHSFPVFFEYIQIIEATAGFFSAAALPIVIILILLRNDVHRLIEAGQR